MEKFGWGDHTSRIAANWDATVADSDVVLVLGDISWATRASEATQDLAWIDARRGRKVFVKGNHDPWWGDSRTKIDALLRKYPSVGGAIHQCAVAAGAWVVAGSRLWDVPDAPPNAYRAVPDSRELARHVERECRRLERSIDEARKMMAVSPSLRPIAAVHYPPRYANGASTAFSMRIEAWGPAVCAYAHLHGPGIADGFKGVAGGVRYVIASSDAVDFAPLCIDEAPS